MRAAGACARRRRLPKSGSARAVLCFALVLERVRWYGRAVVDAPQALWLLAGVSRVDFQGQF